MEKRESGRDRSVGAIIDNATLQLKLNKALEDADYWRLTYDKLLKHIEQKDQYIAYLESQVFGGKTF